MPDVEEKVFGSGLWGKRALPVERKDVSRAVMRADQTEENPMNNTVDELTVDYEEDGILKIKEIDKEVLSKGAWATVLFRYREWQENDTYGPDRYVIRRYKKSGGEYRQQSKFTISSNDQARRIVDALSRWMSDEPEEGK